MEPTLDANGNPIEQNQEDETGTTTQEGAESTPPPNSQEDDAQMLILNTIREQASVIQSLKTELDGIRNTISNPPTPKQTETDPLDDPSVPDFMKDQLRATDRLITKRLEASVAPINNSIAAFTRQNQIGLLKENLSKHPNLGPIYAIVKNEVDSFITNTPNLTPESVTAALFSYYGQAVAKNGGNNLTTNNGGGNNNMPNNPAPRNIPNNNPPPNKPPSYKFTEDERAIMRMYGMTEAEYLAYKNSSGDVSELVNIGPEGLKNG